MPFEINTHTCTIGKEVLIRSVATGGKAHIGGIQPMSVATTRNTAALILLDITDSHKFLTN